jgi:protein-S-isoprenylcysteine O-methyltransferase Ste14
MNIFVLVRAITYATLFIGFLFVYVPGLLLGPANARPVVIEAPQIAGMIITAAGAMIALWCVFAFVFVGKGTPAPFDPPRRLVVHGPYRVVRNPMYIGAILALLGAALFYGSLSILIYAGAFVFATHLFVVFYEEPTLRRTFGSDYEAYCRRVGRWWPAFNARRQDNERA